jgi:coenzyme F420-reducing hydrogenase alpha subunit
MRRLVDEGSFEAGAAPVSPLPGLDRAALAGRLLSSDAEAFIAEPMWDGAPRETSPLSRTHRRPPVEALKTERSYGVGARLAACLLELSQIPARMLALLDETWPEAPGAGGGLGVAQVEAARGLLVHAVEMEGGKVARYRILAPTEWNFHPEGAVAQGLRHIAEGGGGREARAFLARLFVMSADPCVGAEVRVH